MAHSRNLTGSNNIDLDPNELPNNNNPDSQNYTTSNPFSDSNVNDHNNHNNHNNIDDGPISINSSDSLETSISPNILHSNETINDINLNNNLANPNATNNNVNNAVNNIASNHQPNTSDNFNNNNKNIIIDNNNIAILL
ncbi:uncharacterized protein ASCRUDRAFT_72713 [Ascoidea rubescens DSM 1968]|uniref:Uncharacterized protein n=1 Tax=Ascoidea rubescens DSM 1968 TaxID=1344418 RepID=A0A1D2V9G1_9ASCO|nr:hypothetical protein ASCRUDRAFT_72713 [Ascoidea rubescens DSM 1968]ODV58300.1 hypothetical protein ASCRUDRAFT_72713 [Ascoidea rubescens DSM 1968]